MRLISYTEENLVKRHRGTMPIILTSPHGGEEEPAGVSERTNAPAGCQFEKSRDRETSVITEGVARKIFNVIGLSPYVVIAAYHRKYIDANRSEDCAFTDPDAVPFYREYHNRIDEYVNEILSQNNDRGFLFDIHGFTDEDQPEIFLGTENGKSLPDFDRGDMFKQHGLQGLLKSYQYDVSPVDEASPEVPAFNGGFTIEHYGEKINSIQIELSDFIRLDSEKCELFIEDFCFAVINSVRRHIPF